jgi:hypothetical protein
MLAKGAPRAPFAFGDAFCQGALEFLSQNCAKKPASARKSLILQAASLAMGLAPRLR